MNDIKKALQDRNLVYLDMTQKALALFGKNLDKAVQYYIKLDRDITWGTAEFVNGNENYLYVSGFLHVKAGDTVLNNKGERIIIDDDFIGQNTTKTLVRILISVEALQSDNPKRIFQEIKDYYTLTEHMPPEEIAKFLRDFKTIQEILEEALRDVPQPTPTMVDGDFDMSSLTEEQKNQIMFFKRQPRSLN